MPLDALAPDQRAVVQLVLQQGRSYADLAGLLGIDEAAVRSRAHNGLAALAPGGALSDDERAAVADFLLGQQSLSGRERTRSLLTTSATARDWAEAVIDELDDIAGDRLPEIPAPAAPAAPPPREPEPEPPVPVAEDEEPFLDEDEDYDLFTEPEPRPARPARAERPVQTAARRAPRERPGRAKREAPVSRVGGFVLITGVALLIAALIIWLITRGDDNEPASSGDQQTQTATPTATPQIVGQINMRGSGDTRGIVQVVRQGDQLGFNLVAENVPANRKNEAYGVWLRGGTGAPVRLGFTPTVGSNGELATQGGFPPNPSNFTELVVSRETSENAKKPGPTVLRGSLRGALGSG